MGKMWLRLCSNQMDESVPGGWCSARVVCVTPCRQSYKSTASPKPSSHSQVGEELPKDAEQQTLQTVRQKPGAQSSSKEPKQAL